MPTRYLKPGIRDSGHIEALSGHPDAELLYYRLIVTVDDFGRFDGRGDMVKAYCFPTRLRATADKCIHWLKLLADAGLILLYSIEDKPYLQITKWDNKPRAERSKFPPPPVDVYTCPQMLPVTVTVTETSNREPQPKEGRGKPKTNGHTVELPDWMPLDHWHTFLAMRTKLRKPATPRAQRLLIGRLAELKELGHNPAALLAQSELKCWLTFYEPKP